MPPSHGDKSEAETQQSGVRRLGLIGHPIAHSRSPAMQQAAFDALGLPARYELWDTPDVTALAGQVAALRQPDIVGANATIPWKEAVAPLLDDLDESARRIAGAVNTITRAETEQGVRLTGHNTDAPARFLDAASQATAPHHE